MDLLAEGGVEFVHNATVDSIKVLAGLHPLAEVTDVKSGSTTDVVVVTFLAVAKLCRVRQVEFA